MNLRAATSADGAALAALHATAFDEPWPEHDILRFAEDRGGFALIAEGEAGEAPAGFILCRMIAGEAEVLTLAVRPEARRRGIGRALLEAAVVLAQPSADAMFLEVAADNSGAAALYAGAGFELVGRRAGYYGRPGGSVDALVMRRALNS